jgi:hypothetical protein
VPRSSNRHSLPRTKSEPFSCAPWHFAELTIATRVIEELTGRFTHFLKTGDDSRIPGDLEIATYQAVSVAWPGLAPFDPFLNKQKN